MNIKKTVALFVSVVLVLCSSLICVSAEEISIFSLTEEEYKNYKMYMPSLMSIDENNIGMEALRKCLYNGVYEGIGVYNEKDIYNNDNSYNFAVLTDAAIDISKFRIYDNKVIADLLFENMPELLKVIGKILYISNSKTGLIVSVVFIYRENVPSDFKTVFNEFEKEADNMTSGLKTDKLSDVQKALILHDRIIAKCEYDTVAAEELEYFNKINEGNPDAIAPWDAAITAYGAIVEGSAVCQGYTEAYEYLLKKVGIESIRCQSDLLNHIWNILFINGKSYHVDVTWDDPVLEDQNGNFVQKPLDYISHENFMLSSNAIFQNGHNKDGINPDYDFSPSDTTYDNYFWKSCHHETFLIGGGLYHYNDDGNLCEYDTTVSLAESGIGDIDDDKSINSVDISYCRRFVMGKMNPTNRQFTACDITKDGNLSLSDLVRMKKILLYIK